MLEGNLGVRPGGTTQTDTRGSMRLKNGVGIFFETRFPYVALSVLEHTQRSACLYLLGALLKGAPG